jgi:hypothetical protein
MFFYQTLYFIFLSDKIINMNKFLSKRLQPDIQQPSSSIRSLKSIMSIFLTMQRSVKSSTISIH